MRSRAGLIKGFTGVSDPYEEPRDADLVLDTSVMTRNEAVGAMMKLLISGGWLAEAPGDPAEPGAAAAARTAGSMTRPGPAVRRL